MGLEGIRQCEVSQANINMYDVTHRWNVKTLNHRNKEQSGGSQWLQGGGQGERCVQGHKLALTR